MRDEFSVQRLQCVFSLFRNCRCGGANGVVAICIPPDLRERQPYGRRLRIRGGCPVRLRLLRFGHAFLVSRLNRAKASSRAIIRGNPFLKWMLVEIWRPLV